MKTAEQTIKDWYKNIPRESINAAVTAFIVGMLTHLPAMLSEIPNHDGLASLYFDQNMITSGRWFLMVACGISSFYSVPWVIGILGMIYLAMTAGILVRVLGIEDRAGACAIGGMLVVFPSLASTFAYVYTLDGYMLGLLLAVASVYFAGKGNEPGEASGSGMGRIPGWIVGGVCLAFSMGIYQAYLPFAMVLSLFGIFRIAADALPSAAEKWKAALRYVCMGVLGAALYYLILQILLKVQGKELDTYQGISGGLGGSAIGGAAAGLPGLYRDFVKFTMSKAFWAEGFVLTGMVILGILALLVMVFRAGRDGWLRRPGFWGLLLFFLLAIPLCFNVVLLLTPGVNYHLMMRYQWVLLPMMALALFYGYGERSLGKHYATAGWIALLCSVVLIFGYALADNIGYTNLHRKYEKTYAYCVRLLDRIEQTPGYYQGIPVAIVGVVGEDPYPVSDITGDVTESMIGLSGDYLLYSPSNYQAFLQNYLGATLNFLETEQVAEIYYSDAYVAMDSFPGENSVQIIDGVLCVKTENSRRD